ncbi:MAG: TonB-dependent receptor [Thermodesulfobacteria bacterium]|nr:TonB-dependent receptor [Thermodesulfobacteriota bacterium]
MESCIQKIATIGVIGAVIIFLTLEAVVAGETPENKYMSMSIQQLMNIKVTSVSKTEEALSDSAAAIYVITQEDIRRSGVTSIPEALRMAPGVQVAQIDANKWAITARGFNDKYANKLLVLMDGRTVYTPLYSGVYWDVQDTILEDIDRIEVIRGPGATLWGSNAVNGVINIITKSAKETQGLLLAGGAGNQERGFGEARYGGRLGNLSYRFYGKGFYRASYPYGKIAEEETHGLVRSGDDADDHWASGRGGFRADWQDNRRNSLTLQGAIYTGYSDGQDNLITNEELGVFENKANLNGGFFLSKWKHKFVNDQELTVQFYYDRTKRQQVEFGETRNTLDLDIQQTLKLPFRQKAILGFGYRYSSDDTEGIEAFHMDPEDKILHWISGFIQDEIHLIPKKLTLTIGSKFENNDYTGFEVQPSVRILWKPTQRHIFWAAISRAVRTPCRGDTSFVAHAANTSFEAQYGPFKIPAVWQAYVNGHDDFKSEKLIAYEMGYRVMPWKDFSLDIATFVNDYDDLRTFSLISRKQEIEWNGPLPEKVYITDWYHFENHQSGQTYGVEVAATLRLKKYWTLYSTYSWMNYHLHYDSDTTHILTSPSELSPRQQFSIRSYLDLPYNLEFDSAIYYSDGLDGYDVPAYTRVDLRFAWKPFSNTEASLTIQNLLDNQHPEFGGRDDGIVPSEVPRSFYFKTTVKF